MPRSGASEARIAEAGLTCRGAARAKLASQTLALRRQESRRRAWTRCAKHGLSAQTQRRREVPPKPREQPENQIKVCHSVSPQANFLKCILEFRLESTGHCSLTRPARAAPPRSRNPPRLVALCRREACAALMEGSTALQISSLTWPARAAPLSIGGLAPHPCNPPFVCSFGLADDRRLTPAIRRLWVVTGHYARCKQRLRSSK